MPSTYTLNNGIELIGTGEQSGTWGDTTNTNFELLDTALDGQVSVTLAATGSSGSPNTLPISDGASSNGRNRLVIFGDGGDLGGTAFVQLTPNDAEKIIYVRNNLSGSRSILLFQGTYNASNDYEVPAGTTAVVFFNGAGSGAVAANVFNNAFFDSLRLGSVSVDKILDEDNMASDDAAALATQQSIKAYVDSQVGTVDTLAEILANGNTTGANNIIVTAGQSITVDTISETTAANGVVIDGVTLKDGGATVTADVSFGANDKAIFGAGSDLQIYFNGSDGVINESVAGNLLIQGDNIYLQNSAATASYLRGVDGGAIDLRYAGNVKLATTSTGIDVTGTVTADGLTVDGTGVVGTFSSSNNNTVLRVKGNGATNGGAIGSTSSDDLVLLSGLTEKMRIDSSGNVGIGTTSPAYNLHVSGSEGILRLSSTSSGTNFDIGSGSAGQTFLFQRANSYMHFGTNNTERMRIDSSGRVGIGGVPNTNWRNDTADQEVLMLGTEATLFSDAGVTTELWNNAYVDNNDVFKNISTRGASRYFQYQGTHKWFTAASAAAGSNIGAEINSSPKMILDVSGNVLIGQTDSNARLASTSTTNKQLSLRYTGVASYYTSVDSSGNYIIDKDGAERMRISSTGSLLVGKPVTTFNTTGMQIDGPNGNFSITASGATTAFFNRTSTDGNIAEFYKDGSTVGSIGSYFDYFYIGSPTGTDAFIRFGDSIIAPSTSGGAYRDAAIDLGVSTARFKDLYLSGGVYLGGTGAANLLDDYEEGTWTPNVQTNGFSQSVSSTAGRYVKIGEMVYFEGKVELSAAGTTTTHTYISNFPFANQGGSGTGGRQAVGVFQADNPGEGNGKSTGFVRAGQQNYYITLYHMNNSPSADVFLFSGQLRVT